ncbi:MAG: hypothetical protein ACJ75M_20385, partial [Actinomycetes bacterium]
MKEDLGRDTAQNRRAAPHRAHRTGRRRRWAVAATLLVLAGTATAGGLVLDRDPGPAPDPAPGAAPA